MKMKQNHISIRMYKVPFIISKCTVRGWGWGRSPGYLSDMSVYASYHDYQEYIWFMGGDLDPFQDNLQNE